MENNNEVKIREKFDRNKEYKRIEEIGSTKNGLNVAKVYIENYKKKLEEKEIESSKVDQMKERKI